MGRPKWSRTLFKKYVDRAFDFDNVGQMKRMKGCEGCYYRGYLSYEFPICEYIAVTDRMRKAKVRKGGGCAKYLTQERGRRRYGMSKPRLLSKKGI